jgi:glutaminyl-peptide cyclotransferase
MTNRFLVPLSVASAALCLVCSAPADPPPATKQALPASALREGFSGDRALEHVAALSSLAPRANGLPGHAMGMDYLRLHLRSCGGSPSDHRFSHQGSRDSAPRSFTNILARFGPSEGPWILLGAHHDTRAWADRDPDPRKRLQPIEGANDGGSGTAVLLEVATVLKERPPSIGVVLVFFDGEDHGAEGTDDYFVGSRRLVSDWDELFGDTRPELAVIVDMVGDTNLQMRRETYSERSYGWLVDAFWMTGARLGYGEHLLEVQRAIRDDHLALMAHGIPSTVLIDLDYPHWHTSQDTLDKVSASSLEVAGKLVIATLLEGTLPRPGNSGGGPSGE